MSHLVPSELEGPTRPQLIIGGAEPYRGYGPYHGFQTQKVYRLTCILHCGPVHADIQRYEVHVCVQRIHSVDISRWCKVGEIISRDKTTFLGAKCPEKKVVSRRIAGFEPGFRYQIVVRGVDVFGREGAFSRPVDVIIA